MVWLGVKHVESALEGAYASLPGETLFEEGVFHQRPRSTCHAEAEQRLCSQMDQMEGIKTGDPLSSFFPIRSSARFLRSEARFSSSLPPPPPPRERLSTPDCSLDDGAGRHVSLHPPPIPLVYTANLIGVDPSMCIPLCTILSNWFGHITEILCVNSRIIRLS